MVIIIVDNNESDLNRLDDSLRSVYGDAKIIRFSNPSKAFKSALEIKPDWFITEAQLGNQDGIVLARNVKEKCPNVFLAIVSDSTEYTYNAWKIHAKSYLLKPISKEKILRYL